MENKDVAKILRETAQLLEIDGAIIGRYRSYEKVAELLDGMPERIEDIAKDDTKLQELPGIGEGMTAHIHEILKTGDYSLRQKLLKKYPPSILDSAGGAFARAQESGPTLEEVQGRQRRGPRKAGSRRKTARHSRLRRKERTKHPEGR